MFDLNKQSLYEAFVKPYQLNSFLRSLEQVAYGLVTLIVGLITQCLILSLAIPYWFIRGLLLLNKGVFPVKSAYQTLVLPLLRSCLIIYTGLSNLFFIVSLISRSIATLCYTVVQIGLWMLQLFLSTTRFEVNIVQTFEDREATLWERYQPQFFQNDLYSSMGRFKSFFAKGGEDSNFGVQDQWEEVTHLRQSIKQSLRRIFIETPRTDYIRPYQSASGVVFDLFNLGLGLRNVLVGLIIIPLSFFDYIVKLSMLCFTRYSWKEAAYEFDALTASLAHIMMASTYLIACGFGDFVSIIVLFPIRTLRFLGHEFLASNTSKIQTDQPQKSSSGTTFFRQPLSQANDVMKQFYGWFFSPMVSNEFSVQPFTSFNDFIFHCLYLFHGIKNIVSGLLMFPFLILQFIVNVFDAITQSSWRGMWTHLKSSFLNCVYRMMLHSYGIVYGVALIVSTILLFPIRMLQFQESASAVNFFVTRFWNEVVNTMVDVVGWMIFSRTLNKRPNSLSLSSEKPSHLLENIKQQLHDVFFEPETREFIEPFEEGRAILPCLWRGIRGVGRILVGVMAIPLSLLYFCIQLLLLLDHSWNDAVVGFKHLVSSLVYLLLDSSYAVIFGLGEICSVIFFPIKMIRFLINISFIGQSDEPVSFRHNTLVKPEPDSDNHPLKPLMHNSGENKVVWEPPPLGTAHLFATVSSERSEPEPLSLSRYNNEFIWP